MAVDCTVSTLIALAQKKNIGSDNRIIFTDNETAYSIALSDFILDLGAAITAANTPKKAYVNADYTMTKFDDIVFCDGDLNVTLPLGSTTDKMFNIRADGGTVTLLTQGSDTVEQSIVVDGVGLQVTFNSNSSEWAVL